MTKFKVGDRVLIRQWDDMVKEFGVDEDGDIPCYLCFTSNMKSYCGTAVTISEVHGEYYSVKENDWCFTDDMIERSENIAKSEFKGRVEPKKMTLSEIEKALGYPVEIVEEG